MESIKLNQVEYRIIEKVRHFNKNEVIFADIKRQRMTNPSYWRKLRRLSTEDIHTALVLGLYELEEK